MEFGENKVKDEEFQKLGEERKEKREEGFSFFFVRRCSCVEEDEITVMIKKIIIYTYKYININN